MDISQAIDHIWQAPDDDGGMFRQFVPALYSDNLVQMENDPGYLARLRGLGAKELTDAYEKGDWNIREDAIFGGILDENAHLIEPFAIPSEWKLDRGYDHGTSAPASCLWFAEANGEALQLPSGKIITPPARSLFVVSELYFGTYDEKGLDLDPIEVAKRIKEHEEANLLRRAKPGPADSSIFEADPGYVSVADMMKVPYGVRWIKADKTAGSRKRGVTFAKQMFKNRTQSRSEPWLVISKECIRLWAHLKNLPRDEEDPDDVSTLAVAHDWDVLRYRILRSKKQARQMEVEGT